MYDHNNEQLYLQMSTIFKKGNNLKDKSAPYSIEQIYYRRREKKLKKGLYIFAYTALAIYISVYIMVIVDKFISLDYSSQFSDYGQYILFYGYQVNNISCLLITTTNLILLSYIIYSMKRLHNYEYKLHKCSLYS